MADRRFAWKAAVYDFVVLRGGIASVGAAVVLVLAGCGGGGSKSAAVCGAQDAAVIQKRIEATGGRTMIVKPSGSPSGEHGFTRVVEENVPGFVALWVDAYCSPGDAAKGANGPKGIGGLVEVIGTHAYVGLPAALTHTPQQQTAFQQFVSVSEAH